MAVQLVLTLALAASASALKIMGSGDATPNEAQRKPSVAPESSTSFDDPENPVKKQITTCVAKIQGSLNTSHPDDQALHGIVDQVKACSTGGGMEKEEYFAIFSYVRDNAPLKLLVWGLGMDSVVLAKMNANGESTFLEPDGAWVQLMQGTPAGQTLNIVQYDQAVLDTKLGKADQFFKNPHRAAKVDLLAARPCYDMVLVDSPNGMEYCPECPGRQVPIYTAKEDAEQCIKDGKLPSKGKDVTVWVHDNNRTVEDDATSKYLLASRLEQEWGSKKLRKYKLGGMGL